MAGGTPDDGFVESMLENMDLKAKIGQLSQIEINLLMNDDKTELRQDLVNHYIGELGVGSVLNVPITERPWTDRDFRKAVAMIQSTAKRNGRPPVIWGLDSVHGANYLHGRIVTPQPINLAATFNREVSRKAGMWASQDTRRAGINWLFSPLLGLGGWEPNWSRVYETFGEDPFVVGEMALHLIRGIQQVDENLSTESNSTSGIVPSKAAACAKHFLGYSIPHNGHDRSPSWIPTRHLYQYFLPPWMKVIDEVETVMESYTEIDGVPNVANRDVLDGILRRRLGFKKVLVTDYSEIYNMNDWHGVAKNKSTAVLQSMQEGTVDMSMIPWDTDTFFDSLAAFHASGDIGDERIDTSVKRVLQLKQDLNMFDEEITEDNVDFTDPTDEDMEDALEMTRQSIILAKNEDSALPLPAFQPLKVLVTGPTSASLSYQSGGWTWQWQGSDPSEEDKWFTYGKSVLDAIQHSGNPNWDVSYQCGVDIMGGECQDDSNEDDNDNNHADESNGKVIDKVKGWIGWGDEDPISYVAIERAIAKAKDMDVVVICVGEESYAEKPGDIRSLRLPQGQYALVEAIKSNTNAKIVLVYFGGRSRLLADMVEKADAVIIGFLPGPLAGKAVYQTLVGDSNPSAKMPLTYPKHEDGGGVPYLHAISDQCSKDSDGPMPHYEYTPCEVQWPFGHGLSYSTFEYSDIKISTSEVHHDWLEEDGHFDVSVTVTNTGQVAGMETVLVFSFDEYRSTTPEYKRLRGFEKIHLEPDESKFVTIPIPVADLKFVGPHDDSHYIYENLSFRIGVGAHTDCRTIGQGDDKNDSLCSAPIPLTVDADYVGACESACDIWKMSGCMGSAKMNIHSCWDKCTSIHRDSSLQMNNDGWGYNYVECLESIVSNNDFKSDPSQCWKMTAFCRDVLATPTMDELGHGLTPSQFESPGLGGVAILVLSLIAGVVAAVSIVVAMRGGCAKKRDRFGDIQFTGIPTGSFMD